MFHLSKITSVEVKSSQFTTDKYLHLKKQHGNYSRWVNLSCTSWNKLTSMSHDIDGAIAAAQNQSFDLFSIWSGSQKVLIESFQDKLYIGIHSFHKGGQRIRGRGLNLNLDEWKKWQELATEISTAMTSTGIPETWQYSETNRSMFKWVWRTKDGDVKNEGQWTFSYQECFQAALYTVDKCIFTIKEKETPLPSASSLLIMCYDHLVQKTARSLVKCNGCVIDHPSQTQHLDGCLMSQDSAMLLYSQEARQMLTAEEVMTFYNRVRQELGLQTTVGDFDVNSYLKHAPLTFSLEKAYTGLFDKLML